jgi:small subunit ribosomal protein S18
MVREREQESREEVGAEPARRRPRGRFSRRRKVCMFCVDHVTVIDYKDVSKLRRFLSDRGRIEP